MPERPPKEWWDSMEKEVRQGNPDYSEEQIRKTVGDIWYNKLSPSKKREETKKSEGSIHVSQLLADVDADILEGMARALFVLEWADREEEKGEALTLSGLDLFRAAPPTPPEAYQAAADLVKKIEAANPGRMLVVPEGEDAEQFGSDLALEALGTGARWSDDHEDHPYKIPAFEWHWEPEDTHQAAKKQAQLEALIEDLSEIEQDNDVENLDVNKFVDQLPVDEEKEDSTDKELDTSILRLPNWSGPPEVDPRFSLEDLKEAISVLWKPTNMMMLSDDEAEKIVEIFEKAQKFLPALPAELLENKEEADKISGLAKIVDAWLPELKKALGITAATKTASVLDGIFSSLKENMHDWDTPRIHEEAKKLYDNISSMNEESLDVLAGRDKMDPYKLGQLLTCEALGQECTEHHSCLVPKFSFDAKTAQEAPKSEEPKPAAPAPEVPKAEAPAAEKEIHVTDLFSKKFENWIMMEVELRAQMGDWASLDEANAKIDSAVQDIAKFLQDAVPAEVDRLVSKRRDELLEQMAAEIPAAQALQPVPVTEQPGVQVQPVNTQTIQPQPTAAKRVAAMSEALRTAFDRSE